VQKCLDLLSAEVHAATEKYGPEAGNTKFITGCLDFGKKHYDVIKGWGRFPHRNKILGRMSTPEEDKGLEDGTIGSF
jgi:uncharacterized protein (DUF924 family)